MEEVDDRKGAILTHLSEGLSGIENTHLSYPGEVGRPGVSPYSSFVDSIIITLHIQINQSAINADQASNIPDQTFEVSQPTSHPGIHASPTSFLAELRKQSTPVLVSFNPMLLSATYNCLSADQVFRH